MLEQEEMDLYTAKNSATPLSSVDELIEEISVSSLLSIPFLN